MRRHNPWNAIGLEMRRRPWGTIVIGCESHRGWYELHAGCTTNRIFLGNRCAEGVAGAVDGFVVVELPIAIDYIRLQKRAARVQDRIAVATRLSCEAAELAGQATAVGVQEEPELVAPPLEPPDEDELELDDEDDEELLELPEPPEPPEPPDEWPPEECPPDECPPLEP